MGEGPGVGVIVGTAVGQGVPVSAGVAMAAGTGVDVPGSEMACKGSVGVGKTAVAINVGSIMVGVVGAQPTSRPTIRPISKN